MDIEYSVAGDDSCQIQLYVKGHVGPLEFKAACEKFYKENFGKDLRVMNVTIKRIYWRTVPVKGNDVCDFRFVESKPGPGAYPVTVIANWLPMH